MVPLLVLWVCREDLQKWKVDQRSKGGVSEGLVQWSEVFRFGEVVCPPPAVVMMVVSAVNQVGVEVVVMMVVVVVTVRRKGILILGVMENGVGDFGRRIERLLPVGLGNR